VTYAGLTTADKGELINAKQAGFAEYGIWVDDVRGWKRMITVNIDLALAQIAETESAEKPSTPTPLTWNERINQMTVEEKADVAVIISKRCSTALEKESCPDLTCWQCFIEFLNSPYTEGEDTDEG